MYMRKKSHPGGVNPLCTRLKIYIYFLKRFPRAPMCSFSIFMPPQCAQKVEVTFAQWEIALRHAFFFMSLHT